LRVFKVKDVFKASLEFMANTGTLLKTNTNWQRICVRQKVTNMCCYSVYKIHTNKNNKAMPTV